MKSMNSSPNTNQQEKVVYTDVLVEVITEFKHKLTQYKQDICIGIWDSLCSASTQSTSKLNIKDSLSDNKVITIGEELKNKIFSFFPIGLADTLNGFLCQYCAQTKKFTMSKTFFIYNLEKESQMKDSEL